jgi:hypothetical protein
MELSVCTFVAGYFVCWQQAHHLQGDYGRLRDVCPAAQQETFVSGVWLGLRGALWWCPFTAGLLF